MLRHGLSYLATSVPQPRPIYRLFVCSSAVTSPIDLSTDLKAVKSSILIFLALISLAPVLRTLTAATSSDSIWALSAILFIIHALLADYTPQKPDAHVRERCVFGFISCQFRSHLKLIPSLTSVLSMNAAVSGSAVLASRLITDIAVFALILFSVQAFALFPILRRRLQVLIRPHLFHTLYLSVLSLDGSCDYTAPFDNSFGPLLPPTHGLTF